MVNQIREKDNIVSVRIFDRLKQDMVKEGLITKENLKIAEMTAQQENESPSNILVKLKFLTEEQLLGFIAEKMNVPYVNISNYTIDPTVLDLIPEKIARRYTIIPLFKIEDVLTVAMSDPPPIEISALAGCKVEPVIVSNKSITVAIDQWYGTGNARKKLVEQLANEFREFKESDMKRGVEAQHTKGRTEIDLEKEAVDSPSAKLVNNYIVQAILEGASDIHLEPKKDFMTVRFRIDGFLYDRQRLPAELISSVTSRTKIMSGLDISEKRIPQDGRIGLILRDKKIDIRTSTFPSMYGENVVLRILDKTRGVPTLSELGFSDEDLNKLKKVIKFTQGIILATGPTGSGKTTTIFSALNVLNTTDRNIMTIEDPIEYEIGGIVQSQFNPKAGVSFATALRSILRQDPDIIYVGEIRDAESAEAAVRAALTGHLVLSTLHTNNAVGAITRLRDIGVDTGLIGSALNCAFAQRLVRKICQRCKHEYQPDENFLKKWKLPLDTKFYRAKGCESCSGIGYKGRVGIFEIVNVNKDISELISQNASENEILEALRKQGMKTLLEDGLQKAIKGSTTLEEIERVTGEE
jgi:type IV pilus assembly protein PilB